jgi:hypothetical protein
MEIEDLNIEIQPLDLTRLNQDLADFDQQFKRFMEDSDREWAELMGRVVSCELTGSFRRSG